MESFPADEGGGLGALPLSLAARTEQAEGKGDSRVQLMCLLLVVDIGDAQAKSRKGAAAGSDLSQLKAQPIHD